MYLTIPGIYARTRVLCHQTSAGAAGPGMTVFPRAELLNQTSHHNDKSRRHSLVGLADLFGRHPEQLRLHASQVMGTLAERIVDGDSSVRSALRELLHGSVLPLLGQDALRPFMPVVMAHICGAMTHLSLDIRNDALLFLDVMMDHVPQLVVKGFLPPCLAHFCDIFSAAHRGRSIRAQSLAALSKLLTALTNFLKRAFPDEDSPGAAAAPPVGAAVDAPTAGPGPSSVRQQQLRAQTRSLAARPGAPLGADRLRRPQRSAYELLRQLDELFHAAAAATRAGRKRGKPGGGDAATGGTVDKGRHKKGRGSVSTTETAAAVASGGKGVAAAAAALAAVTSPAAATAAGVELSSASGSAAAGVLGAPTAMAAALAAASDARASALRLVSLLMDPCWLECNPAQLATSPELDQATALAMIVAACNSLIQRLLLPPQPHDQQVGGGDGLSWTGTYPPLPRQRQQQQQRQGVWQGQGPPLLGEQRLALTQQLHDVAARRVAAHFPAVLPPVKPPAAVTEALVRLNLQSAELLGRFLPLLAHSRHGVGQPQQISGATAAAAGNGSGGGVAATALPWVPALVSYYAGALEQGVLLPAAAGTLSDASGAGAAAGQSLSAATADVVLTAVSAALGQLDDAAAARLMSAVSQFAARQPPRSGARLACIRIQHSLLLAAVAGRLFLAEGVVSGWLEPLPKLLWEVGGGSAEVSYAALALLLDAARFAIPGSPMCQFLSSQLQPQLAPLLAVQLPAKAAKAAAAKLAAAASAEVPIVGAGGAAGEVLVVLPGALSKLPEQVAELGVDLIYHTGALGGPLLKPLAAALSSTALSPSLARRLLDVVLVRLRDAPDPALAASWLLTLLFGPQHGLRVISPEGTDLTASWARQRALVDAAVMGLGQLGGAAPLLLVLAPQLAALPLAQATSAGARGARLQRYSLIRLCAAAVGEPGGDKLPPAGPLAEALPAAAALCGIEAGAAAASGEPDGAMAILPYRSTFGPVVQLLTERPVLATAVVRHLAALLRSMAGSEAVAPATTVGCLPLHTAALAALQLAQAVVKLQPVRTALAAAGSEREGLLGAVEELGAAVRNLPVAAAGSGPVCPLVVVQPPRTGEWNEGCKLAAEAVKKLAVGTHRAWCNIMVGAAEQALAGKWAKV
ncbi:hypothetical protein VOLCADRAFT_86599 [Volvox carteri f. nagariensis]|uniref:Uncharacterized protein n=1 Tax=Volvox carteri f. nagariensis TaxID=3068 RepID=D8TJ36_VOLCA|nr:uncharacterized protein VOLCADRAFT_86599 [Volvox carteri f. nagariensis]EFJ52309.1 hypothetical protein VOLCADRAFT_86599 [Volvox carteri f. nagariensis]|eukprot:XP_002946382.1 hypothetical protein VOLCADRAFT_86599 [Volvox carteri f. nagariensis]